MYILIPCKGLRTGKSRLSRCLDEQGRQALCARFLGRTVELAADFVGPSRVRIVTSDRDALDIGSRHGVTGIPDAGAGLNAALDTARTAIVADRGFDGSLLILPIDLPFATGEAVALATALPADVVIAPDKSGTGTNLLLLRAAAIKLPFAFGPGSRSAHLARARANGLTVDTVSDDRLAHDIDAPAQYMAWRDLELQASR